MSRYEGRMRIGETVFEDTGTGKVYQSLPPRDQDRGAVEWKDGQPAPSWYTDQTAFSKPAELYRGLLDVRSTPKSILKIVQENQRESRLLRLPAEIRNRIYRFALGGQHVCIEYEPHHHCYRNRNGVKYKAYTKGGCRFSRYQNGRDTNVHFSPTWRICRQLYHETALMLYSETIFSFQNNWVAKNFLVTLQVPQRKAIHTIYFEYQWVLNEYPVSTLRRICGLKRIQVKCEERAKDSENITARLKKAFPKRHIQIIYAKKALVND